MCRVDAQCSTAPAVVGAHRRPAVRAQGAPEAAPGAAAAAATTPVSLAGPATALCTKLRTISMPACTNEFSDALARFENSVLTAEMLAFFHQSSPPPTTTTTTTTSQGASLSTLDERESAETLRTRAAASIAHPTLSAWHRASAFDTRRTHTYGRQLSTGAGDLKRRCAWLMSHLSALDWCGTDPCEVLSSADADGGVQQQQQGPGDTESPDARLRVAFFAFALLCRTGCLCAFTRDAAAFLGGGAECDGADGEWRIALRSAVDALQGVARASAEFVRNVVALRRNGAMAIAAVLALHTTMRQRGTTTEPVARCEFVEANFGTFRRFGATKSIGVTAAAAVAAAERKRRAVPMATVFTAAASSGAAGGAFGTRVDRIPLIANCSGEHVPLVWPPPPGRGGNDEGLAAIGEYLAHVHATFNDARCAGHAAAVCVFADTLERAHD